MRKQSPKLDWQMVENDEEWERQRALLTPERVAITSLRRVARYWVSVTVLLLLLITAADWWWRATQGQATQGTTEVRRPAQQTFAPVTPDLTNLVASLEQQHNRMQAWYQLGQHGNDLRAAIVATDPTAHWEITLQSVNAQGDQAAVEVVTLRERGAPAHRETRFYAHTTAGWQRTTPAATLWGPAQRLATPYFLYHFRQHDAAVVNGVAPQIDALYTAFQRQLGLPSSVTLDKLVIEVSIEQAPGQAMLAFDKQQLRVPSPALYQTPVELTDADLLAQSIALPLLRSLMSQARAHYRIGQTWQSLLQGLALWQLWDTQLPLAVWRIEIVPWLYVDLPSAGVGQPFMLPKHYAALCAAHKLWLLSPAELNLPLVCTGPALEEQSFALWLVRNPLTRLDQFTVPRRPGAYGQDSSALHAVPQHPAQTVALATLIEYAVAIYGRARLAVLLAGLGQYDSWDTLIPAVYGVSSAQFEAGWQAYLAAHYAVASDLFRK